MLYASSGADCRFLTLFWRFCSKPVIIFSYFLFCIILITHLTILIFTKNYVYHFHPVRSIDKHNPPPLLPIITKLAFFYFLLFCKLLWNVFIAYLCRTANTEISRMLFKVTTTCYKGTFTFGSIPEILIYDIIAHPLKALVLLFSAWIFKIVFQQVETH